MVQKKLAVESVLFWVGGGGFRDWVCLTREGPGFVGPDKLVRTLYAQLAKKKRTRTGRARLGHRDRLPEGDAQETDWVTLKKISFPVR